MSLEVQNATFEVRDALDCVHRALETFGKHPDVGWALRDARVSLEYALSWLEP